MDKNIAEAQEGTKTLGAVSNEGARRRRSVSPPLFELLFATVSSSCDNKPSEGVHQVRVFTFDSYGYVIK